MIRLTLLDEEYPFHGFTHERKIARAILLNPKGEVALHTVSRDDVFGCQTYFETPGGGVEEGESYEEALKRECQEEVGADIEILCPLGEVEDAYNLIGRKNWNRYYLCRQIAQEPRHFASEGDALIQKTEFYPLAQAIALLKAQDDHGVAGLVKRRELPILEEAKRVVESEIRPCQGPHDPL